MIIDVNSFEQIADLIKNVSDSNIKQILDIFIGILKGITVVSVLKTLGVKEKDQVCGFLAKHELEEKDKKDLMDFYQIREDEIDILRNQSDVTALCDLLSDNEDPEITELKRRVNVLETKIDKPSPTHRQSSFARPTSPATPFGTKSCEFQTNNDTTVTRKMVEEGLANLQSQIDSLKRNSLSMLQTPREHERKLTRSSSKKLTELERDKEKEEKEDKKSRKSQTKKEEEERKKTMKRESRLSKKELEELEKQRKIEEEEEKRKQQEEEEKRKKEELKKQKEEEERKRIQMEEEEKIQQEIRREVFSEDEQLMDLGTQLETLQEWSGLMNCEILFDSDVDDAESDNMKFNEKVMFKENCFFVNLDKKGNVFGGFIKENIGLLDEDVDDDQHFIFSLKKDGKYVPKRWFIKSGKEGGIKLFSNNDCLYQFGNGNLGCFGISKMNLRRNVCCTLSEEYEGISDLDLSGTNWKFFNLDRIVVVHMY